MLNVQTWLKVAKHPNLTLNRNPPVAKNSHKMHRLSQNQLKAMHRFGSDLTMALGLRARGVHLEALGMSVGKGAVIVRDFRSNINNDKQTPVLLVTAEHATNELPTGYSFKEQELSTGEFLAESHWAYDPGSLHAASEIAAAAQGVLVAAAYSRLYIDPNRPLPSDTLVRQHCGSDIVAMNACIEPTEVAARVDAVWSPFHLCLGAVKAALGPTAVLSIHSFNPTYPDMTLGSRDFEVGVLNTFDSNLAINICSALNLAGCPSKINKPYSGKEGIMFSAEGAAGPRIGSKSGYGSPGIAPSGRIPAIMLEFRNDVCKDPAWRKRAVTAVWAAFESSPLY